MDGDESGWLAAFPALTALEPAALALLRAQAQRLLVPRGTVLFTPGALCRHFMLLLDGTIRVQMVAENGREILLYRVARGETCILTTACLMTRTDYGAEGIAESDVAAVTIASQPFHDLLACSAVFRDFVFASFGARLTGLMVLVEEVAFGRIDLRLARLLLDRAGPAGGLDMTHQALAAELGTAREVVSRQLKEFERRGLVALTRGHIAVRDADALAALTESVRAVG